VFINSIISFLIVAFSVFMVVRSFETLLSEICDILRAQAG